MSFDPAFGTNFFGVPKTYTETETLARNILAVLFGKPGSYPTMPNLGMDIPTLVMTMYDDIDEDDLANQLVDNCSEFSEVVTNGDFEVVKTVLKGTHGQELPSLLFKIPTVIKKRSKNLVIGLTITGGQVSYNFTWLDEVGL